MDTTFEEASRCPRCNEAGYSTCTARNRDGAKSFEVSCENNRCPWYHTKWVFDVRADGSIPQAKTNRPKTYAPIPDRTEEVRAAVDRSIAAQERQR
jgi:hypothetical protein